jgi:gliding motility-associated-like protein
VPIVADIDLVVEVSDACANSLTGVVALRLDEPPVVQLPPIIAEGCAPLTVTMPNLGLGSGMQYLWDLGNGNTSAAVAPVVTYNAGTYTVGLTVSTALGCTVGGSVTGQVIAHELPVAAFTASPWITDAANGTIAFTDQSSGAITSHEWQFGDGGTANTVNPSHTYTDVGEFEVVLWVETAHGCVSSVSHTVTITPVYDITFPTAFTPNPNGGNGGVWDPNSLDNDVFYPFARFVEDFRMLIFNRWGELIFESNDMRIGWDGYYRGQLSPQDVYVVQTWFRFVDGKRIEKLTDLTLFR